LTVRLSLLYISEEITFAPGETEQFVEIAFIQKPLAQESSNKLEKEGPNESKEPLGGTEKDNEDHEEEKTFAVQIKEPKPEQCKISKKNLCFVSIVPDDSEEVADEQTEKMIQYFLQQKEETWASKFKNAIMLQPSIDEDGQIDDITGGEAFFHFCSIGWKVFFALIPPNRYWGGWAAFITALTFIGLVTAIVGEFANLFGCAVGLKQAVTAITFVALGTSLPDTFASKQAAQSSEYADSAIGNVTGSNSVNIFLGLGLPWLIAAIYNKSKYDRSYAVPAGDLAFSVILFLSTSVVCIIVLIARRCVSLLLISFIVHRW